MRFYKHNLFFTLALLCVGVLPLAAQQPTLRGAAVIYPSTTGNLISISAKEPTATEALSTTAYFKINRAELLLNNQWTSFKKVGQTKRSKTVAELRTTVGQEGIELIQALKNLPTEKQVQQYLNTEYHFDSLKVFDMYSAKYGEALGVSFTDKLAESGVVYNYQIKRVDKGGREELWAETKIVSKVPNPLLNLVHLKQDTILSSDSLMVFKFHVEFPKTLPAKSDTFPQYSPINTRLSAKEQKKVAKDQNMAFVNHLNVAAIDPARVLFNVYYQENRKGWKSLARYMASPDSIGIYRVGAYIETTPLSLLEVRLIPETFGEVINSPDSSEIFEAYALSQKSVPLIYGVTGKDSTDCIKLNWQLSTKPYHYGILIERSEGGGKIEQLAMLNASATSYTDFKIRPGVPFTYYVKALFNPRQNITQKAAASVSLSCTTFSPPMPPYNLRIDTASKSMPMLKWDAVASNSRFAFIVYRGTDPKKLSHLGNMVKGNTFTDSTAVLSPRLRLYYAIVEQNLVQDTSDFSNIVDFRPKMQLDLEAPRMLNSKLINGDVFLDWPEMRIKDNLIGGYRLERRSELDTIFRSIGPKVMTTNFFVDTTYNRNYFHEYRIAAVADNGELGPYSSIFQVDFPMEVQAGVSTFSLRNTTRGIMVRWPSVSVPTTKEYIIYRNDPPKAQLRKLATVPAGSFEYVDTAVSDTDSYLYAMSIVAKDGVESQRSPRKSLKRAKPNKLPTTPNPK